MTAARDGTLLTLRHDRLVPEVAVSGTVTLATDADVEDGKTVLVNVTVKASGIGKGSFTATWTTAGAGAVAQVVGSVGHQPIAGSMPAP